MALARPARPSTSAPTWVAVPVGRQHDPRVRRLCRALSEPLAEAWITRVEGWLKLYATDGQVRANDLDIADAIRWTYRVGLADTLQACDFLDEKGCLTGWSELNGWLAERAQRERDRHRKPPRKFRVALHGSSVLPTDRPTYRPTDRRSSQKDKKAHSDTRGKKGTP